MKANCLCLHDFILQLLHIHCLGFPASAILLARFPSPNILPLVSTHAWAVLETGLSNQIKQDGHMGIEGQKEERDQVV